MWFGAADIEALRAALFTADIKGHAVLPQFLFHCHQVSPSNSTISYITSPPTETRLLLCSALTLYMVMCVHWAFS